MWAIADPVVDGLGVLLPVMSVITGTAPPGIAPPSFGCASACGDFTGRPSVASAFGADAAGPGSRFPFSSTKPPRVPAGDIDANIDPSRRAFVSAGCAKGSAAPPFIPPMVVIGIGVHCSKCHVGCQVPGSALGFPSSPSPPPGAAWGCCAAWDCANSIACTR